MTEMAPLVSPERVNAPGVMDPTGELGRGRPLEATRAIGTVG